MLSLLLKLLHITDASALLHFTSSTSDPAAPDTTTLALSALNTLVCVAAAASLPACDPAVASLPAIAASAGTCCRFTSVSRARISLPTNRCFESKQRPS